MNKTVRNLYGIEKNEEISEGVYEIRLNAPEIAETAAAGQFVNIYLPGGEMLLPRPIGIADAQDGILTLVYAVVGKGTEMLAEMKNGGKIEVMGPLGTGFFDYAGSPVDRDGKTGSHPRTVLLIGGGLGLPPLFFAAKKLNYSAHWERCKSRFSPRNFAYFVVNNYSPLQWRTHYYKLATISD